MTQETPVTPERTETITVLKTVRSDVVIGQRVVGHVVGNSRIDEQGRWIASLGLIEQSGVREVDLVEGDEFEFAEGTWKVTKVYEPDPAFRSVAQLVRVAGHDRSSGSPDDPGPRR